MDRARADGTGLCRILEIASSKITKTIHDSRMIIYGNFHSFSIFLPDFLGNSYVT